MCPAVDLDSLTTGPPDRPATMRGDGTRTVSPEMVLLYLDTLEAAGRSKGTIVGYRRYLLRFVRNFPSLTSLDVRDFLDTFKSVNTRAFVLAVLRQWFAFLISRGLLEDDPAASIPTPKMQRRHYPAVSQEQFQRLQEALDGELQVLAHLFYYVGTRIAETLELRAEDIAFEGEYGTIDLRKRKGGAPGFAAFGPQVTHILKPYIGIQQRKIFALSEDTVRYYLTRAGKTVNIPGSMTPHRLRHAFIIRAVENGWNQLALQQQIGHSSPNSTAHYYKPSRRGLIDAYKRSSPE